MDVISDTYPFPLRLSKGDPGVFTQSGVAEELRVDFEPTRVGTSQPVADSESVFIEFVLRKQEIVWYK